MDTCDANGPRWTASLQTSDHGWCCCTPKVSLVRHAAWSRSSPARYRTTRRSGHTASLKKRGSSLICPVGHMTRLAPRDGRLGRPVVVIDSAMRLCLTIKALIKLPFRQTTGMVVSLLKVANLVCPAPDHSSPCRQQKTQAVQIPYLDADGPGNLLGGSTGITVLGEGTGAQAGCPLPPPAAAAGHLDMAKVTSDIPAVEFTPSSVGDSPVLPVPLDPQELDSPGTWIARRDRQKRSPERHPSLWQASLEALDRIPRPQPDRGKVAVPQSPRGVHLRRKPRRPDRRDPAPHRLRPPLRCPRQPRAFAWPDDRGERGRRASASRRSPRGGPESSTSLGRAKLRHGFIWRLPG